MKITDDIVYVGVNDHDIDLFEGQYSVPDGMAYNSYVICDEKIVVMDTVDARFGDEWLGNIQAVLADRQPDYLVIQHVEPDHSACIGKFLARYPHATVVANAKAFILIGNFYGKQLCDNTLTVSDGDVLSLGRHNLQFIFAPMVHWPEVMVTYDSADKVLFSADGFGKFGALDVDAEWSCEARRYYFGIVGKYGMSVTNLLNKAAALDIAAICPLHGPVLTDNLGYYLNLYRIWSSYGVESDGVLVAYTSVYGHTKQAAQLLTDELRKRGVHTVLTDLARSDMAEAVEDAFRYGKLVLATTTYNTSIFPFMRHFVDDLVEHGYQNRTVAIIENGSWMPMAAKVIRKRMESCKNIAWLDETVTILSAMTDDNRAQIAALADKLSK